MKRISYVIFAAVSLAALGAPAAAQMGTAGYQGLTFVQAVKDRDGAKAQEALGDNPSSAIVNARDGDGNTALIIAVARRDPEWTGFLLNKGADPNLAGKSGETALIAASRIGFDEAVGWLLSMGAKVDATNRMGETALITAVVQRQPAIVRQLLEAGADPDKTDTAAGYSAREYAQRDSRARDIQQMIQAKKPKPAAAH